MNKNNNAFTLVEMIVGVSITLILMISVGIFVSSGMKNITIQKQILDKNNELGNLSEDLNNIFGLNFEIIQNTSTSILVKSNYILGKPQYYYIGERTSTGYCKNDTDIENKYLEIKAFNPFILTGVIYSGSYIDNVIYSGGQIVAGNGVFGDIFTDGSNGTGIYLNNPSGITVDGGGILYISDSGNNRILYMSGNRIYKLLDIDDGIFKPTGILYYLSKLYILNSGKNEVLVLDSNSRSSKPIALNITPENSITMDKIDIEVLPNNFIINGTYNTGSYDFGLLISKNIGDTVTKTTNKLTYSFTGGSKFLTGGVDYQINIQSFSGNLSSGTYYLKVNLYNGGNTVYEKYFSYVVNGDNDLTTINDNTLTILTGGLNSNFSEIKSSGSSITLNNYINGEYLNLNISSGDFVDSGSLNPINITDFDSVNKITDFKIKNLKIDISGNLLNLKIDYYKNFSCFNEKDSIIKTILLKKIIPN